MSTKIDKLYMYGPGDFDVLAKTIHARPLRNYESFQVSHANASDVLRNGWRLSGFPPVRLDEAITWEDSAPRNRSLVFHLQSWDLLDPILKDYSDSKSDLHLEAALVVAEDWIRKFQHFVPNSVAWYDMAVGMRAYRLAYLLDAAARLKRFDASRGVALMNSLEVHRVALGEEDFFAAHSNHGFYQLCGQLAMGRRFENLMHQMDVAVDQAEERLRCILARQFTKEGIHKEHSPDYQRMLMESMRSLHETGLIEEPEFLTLYQKVEEALAWFIYPNGKLVNFGDSDSRQMQRGRSDAARYLNPVLRYIKSKGEIGAPPRDWVKGFPESGYFIARNSWSENGGDSSKHFYLAQNLAFHSRTHKHADHLTFVWYDRGREILIDAGRFGYVGKTQPKSALWLDGFWYSDPRRIFVESSKAHNTIVIDGRNHERRQAHPFGSALKAWGKLKSGKICYSVGEVKHFRSVRHIRTLIAYPGEWLLVLDWVHDNLRKAHQLEQWFHFAPDLIVAQEKDQLTISRMEADSEFQIKCANFAADARINGPFCGVDNDSKMQGWWSPQEGVLSPAPAAAYTLTGAAATFVTLFSFTKTLVLDREQSAYNATLSKGKFHWQSDRTSHRVLFERAKDGNLGLTYTSQKLAGTRIDSKPT